MTFLVHVHLPIENTPKTIETIEVALKLLKGTFVMFLLFQCDEANVYIYVAIQSGI